MSLFDRISKYKGTDPDYARDLLTALYAIGGDELGRQLTKAEKQGKRLELTYPINPEEGPSEPNGVRIV